MKLFQLSFLLLVYLAAGNLFGQDDAINTPIISKAAYFDKTPPLKDMKIILPGERDRSWKDNIIGNKSMEDEFKNQRADIPANFKDPVLQTNYNGSRGSRGPVINHDGVGNVSGVYPPDTDGDVGSNHYFQMINLAFSIWDKQGNLLYGPADNSTLWQGFIGPWTGTNDGDPIVIYDELADRWMASQFAVNTSNGTYWQLVAVSATSDPLGEYYRYAFQFPAFNDYPKLSIWPDGYYATFNLFGSYTRVGVAAFQRDSMLAGEATAQMIFFNQPNGTFSMLPADFEGDPPPAGSPCYFAHLRTFSTQKFEIYAFDVNWETPASSTFTLIADLQPASFNPNIDGIPQPGTGTQLDALNMMLMYRLQYRNFGSYEAMVTNHTVNAGGRAGIRWYEFRKESGDWYIYQQGTYSPDNNYRWMGSIAMAANGNIALGYSVSSSTIYPSIFYTGRTPGAPLGEMNIDEIKVISGTYSQTGIDRWGDYSTMSVDPVDDTTFWFTTEYNKSMWKTRIVSFDFGPIQPPFVNSGIDTLICESEPFLANAEAYYTQSVLWHSAGDGFFPDPANVDVVYLRGQDDVTNGEVMLWMDGIGYLPGQNVSDTMMLYFSEMAVANAGTDTAICAGETVQMNSSYATYYDSLRWTTEGDGVFDDITILHPLYTPGTLDISKGYAWLRLTAYDTLPCVNWDFDKMKITIDECTGIEAVPGKSSGITIVPNPTSGLLRFTIDGLAGEKEVVISLLNILGQTVFTFRLRDPGASFSNSFDLTYYPKGIYYLNAAGDHYRETRKILFQ